MVDRSSDLEGALANVGNCVDLAIWLAIGNMVRVDDRQLGRGFHLKEAEANQLMSLLIVTRDYARRELKAVE